ncbi:unnamed protein product [Alternaria alternata]
MDQNTLSSAVIEAAQAWEASKAELERQRLIAAATKLIEVLENPAEKLARIGWGEPSRTAALQTAFELGVFDKLTDEPQDSKALAENTPADPLLVGMLRIEGSTATGIDSYVATPFTYATSDPTVRGGLIYSFEGMIPTFHHLPSFLAKTSYQVPNNNANGPVQHALQTKKPFFAILQDDSRLGSAFNDFMTGYGKARPSWVDYYPVHERLLNRSNDTGPLLVDVGGGLGRDISHFHSVFPEARGTLILQDTPSVIAQTQRSTPPLPAGINAMAHDFFTPQPESAQQAQAYYLHLVLHDWDDDSCRKILGHVRDAMKPGYSKLLINENVMEDFAAPWQQTSLDWTMMAMLVNRERTRGQWAALLESVGMKIEGIWRKDISSESVIEAVVVV